MPRIDDTNITLNVSHQQAAALLPLVYQDEPWIRSLLPTLSDPPSLRRHFTVICRQAWQEGQIFVGLRHREELVAVGMVAMPTATRRRLSTWDNLVTYLSLLRPLRFSGAVEAERLGKYLQFIHDTHITPPHTRLEALGVHPAWRRQGLARRLLEAIHQIADDDSTSTGILLHTDNPTALALYQQCGYRIIRSTALGELTLHALFRPAQTDINGPALDSG